MTEHATPHAAPTVVAAELPFPALAGGRYRAGQLVSVVHVPYLVPSTVARLVDQLQASAGRPDGYQALVLGAA